MEKLTMNLGGISSGQSLNDRLQAARYSLAGQGLAKSVCKATTEEVIGPKKKHLDYLIHCTNEPNVSIPQLANLLIERTQNASWVVVFKALVTVHHLMCYGNERFTQYLASSNCNFQLNNFIDKTNVQVQAGYDMSTFIRRYSKYLNEKALSYRTQAFDFCKVKRGSEGVLRTMNAEKLVKTIPVLQNQMDALLEFDCTANDLTNGVINAAFMLLFRDLIRLFACYNDGIINLLEKYFDMNKKMCRDALDIYKKFLIRMDRVAEFLKVAESVGIDKGEIPDLARAPSSLLEALEQHLAALEGRKITGPTTPTQSNHKPISGGVLVLPNSVKSAVLALSSTSNAFGTAAASGNGEMNGFSSSVDDSVKKMILEEEQQVLNQHKERRLKELGESPVSAGSTNPFLSGGGDGVGGESVMDLFGGGGSSAHMTDSVTSKASDDLLCLANNPFADGGEMQQQQQPHHHQQPPPRPTSQPFDAAFWGGGSQQQQQQHTNGVSPSSTFVSSSNFAAAFGSSATNNSGFDAFGDVLQPKTPMMGQQMPAQPAVANQQNKPGQTKVITGDLDSSLASLAQNLDINRGAQMMKGNQMWNSPKNTAKTGGANWMPQVCHSTTPSTTTWSSPQHAFPQQQQQAPQAMGAFPTGQVPQQNMMGGMRPMMPAGAPRMGMGMMPSGQPVMYPGGMQPRPAAPQQPGLDPFGL